MQNQSPMILRDLVKKMISTSPHRHKLEEAMLIEAWHRTMPLAIQKRTTQIYVHKQKLFVKLSSAPLRQELQNQKKTLVALLQNATEDCPPIDIVFL